MTAFPIRLHHEEDASEPDSAAEIFASLLEDARAIVDDDLEAAELVQETLEVARIEVEKQWPGTSTEAGFQRMIMRLQIDEMSRLAAEERAAAEEREKKAGAEFEAETQEFRAWLRARFGFVVRVRKKGVLARAGEAIRVVVARVVASVKGRAPGGGTGLQSRRRRKTSCRSGGGLPSLRTKRERTGRA